MYRLARFGATQKEIASLVGCDYKTLLHQEWFPETYERGQSALSMSLRRQLVRRAMDPKSAPGILIFALKNLAGMSDNPNATPGEGAAEVAQHLRNALKKAAEMEGAA